MPRGTHEPQHQEHRETRREGRREGGGQHGKINLNNANKEQLMEIEGVSEQRANLILQYRDEHGGFKNIEEIDSVPGFSDVLSGKVKEAATV